MANLFFASLQLSWFDIRMESSMLLAEATPVGWKSIFETVGPWVALLYVILALMQPTRRASGGGRRHTHSTSENSYSSNDYESYTPQSQWSDDQGQGWGNTHREDFGHGP